MDDHRSKLDIPGLGTWILESDTGEVEFLADQNVSTRIHALLYKALSIPNRAIFVDPPKTLRHY